MKICLEELAEFQFRCDSHDVSSVDRQSGYWVEGRLLRYFSYQVAFNLSCADAHQTVPQELPLGWALPAEHPAFSQCRLCDMNNKVGGREIAESLIER
jgi:hypothetical protein